MKRRTVIKALAAAFPATWGLSSLYGRSIPGPDTLPGSLSMQKGPFTAEWSSLEKYTVPDWYRDAKFGIWAHWGVQCQPEYGDWYARTMYMENTDDYTYHVKKYGHPSSFGFKDVINEWKAEKWNPDSLVEFYKNAGARYFVAMANHHDNFDNYKSSYQSWNSVHLGPKKDIIGGWAKAAKTQGLPFGVSVHAAHAWTWYETSQRSDKSGPLAAIPYDGKLTKADGKGKWWEGYDPQELYAQNHALSKDSDNNQGVHGQWEWGNGASVPDQKYYEKFYNRTIELLNNYQPDLLYFDDTALPLWPVNDAGLRIASHFYNDSIKRHGMLRAVLNGKVLNEQQRKCMVWDIERGTSNTIEPFVWQTDTCIGNWHYDRRVYEGNKYKSAKTVIQILVDVVSKNGNLLLNVPVRGDGSIDEKEHAIVEEVGRWMKINGDSIFGTRPWNIFGEGPAISTAVPITAQGFNEGKSKPLDFEDFRFNKKGDVLYATFFGWPENKQVVIKALSKDSTHAAGSVTGIELLGHKGKLEWLQQADGVLVKLPEVRPCDHAFVLILKGVV